MSKATPLKMEYLFQINEHTMKASAEHLELARRFTFYFDDKIVSEKAVPAGDFYTDDDCISELVENYCKNKSGVYADLFSRHSDKVKLVAKKLDFQIENCGIKMMAHICIEKEKYHIEVKGANGIDSFTGTFQAVNFSEALEKVRIFTSTLSDISDDFSSHISELANDKVEAWIKWES